MNYYQNYFHIGCVLKSKCLFIYRCLCCKDDSSSSSEEKKCVVLRILTRSKRYSMTTKQLNVYERLEQEDNDD